MSAKLQSNLRLTDESIACATERGSEQFDHVGSPQVRFDEIPLHTKGASRSVPRKITRRTLIGAAAGACAYAALTPLVATAKRLSFLSHLPAADASGISWPPTQALPSFAAPVQLAAGTIRFAASGLPVRARAALISL
jgi:hypothetical protein